MPVGALLWVLYPWVGSQRSETVCGMHFGRCWKTGTPDDGFDSLGFLDTQEKGTDMEHETSCPGVGYAGNVTCPEVSLCANICD